MATEYIYDEWMEAQGVPVHRGFFIEDLRRVELGWWPMRKMQAAFIQLAGQEGICEARVSEIPPGETTTPFKLSLDEAIYVLQGTGTTAIWTEQGKERRTFEWAKRSYFLVPRNAWHQISNMSGTEPVRLLHYNYLPVGMTAIQDPDFFFNNPNPNPCPLDHHSDDVYSEAKSVENKRSDEFRKVRLAWRGNFFPDLGVWDRLEPHRARGAGGSVVDIEFLDSPIRAHMSVFPPQRYKKGHRHGPGRVIVIPAGEGYSVMWPEGQEKVVAPWHEASMFVPPNRWFHQHFNVGGTPARYLAMHPMPQFAGRGEKVEDRARDQIEYNDEDPFIRQKFEGELEKRGLHSAMPEEAYRVPNFQWEYRSAG